MIERKLIFIFMVVGLSVSLFGCATPASLETCSKLDETSDYHVSAARAGDRESQYQLGVQCFEAGDTSKAIKWLEYAAKDTHETDLVFVEGGNGDFTMRNDRTGVIISGHREAKLLLADIYEKGLGVEVDLNKAKKYRGRN